MSVGAQLRAARERKQLTTSDVAGATRSKMQIIEAIERDDFSVFAAPIYGKGFIRLYAQVVGLDPNPLLEEFAGGAKRPLSPTLTSAEYTPPDLAAPAGDNATPRRKPGSEDDLFNATAPRARAVAVPAVPAPVSVSRASAARELLREVFIRWWQALRESLKLGRTSAVKITTQKDPWTAVPVVIGIVIILIFVVSGLSRCAHWPVAEGTAGAARAPGGALRLAAEVPEPYFE